MKLITCTVCDDKTPYRKKDYKAHLAKHVNYASHCDALVQKIKAVRADIQTTERDISQLLIDAEEEELVIYEEVLPAKHRDFKQYMLYTVAKHVRNAHKQLQVEYNLLRQLFSMRKQHRTNIERIIEAVRDEREREEEEEANRWDDEPHWRDFD
jgi:hypothetical protein